MSGHLFRRISIFLVIAFTGGAIISLLTGGAGSIGGTRYHDTISIKGNLDLEAKALIENWKGNGAAENPYVIEGYVLETDVFSPALNLTGVTEHLLIRNCTIINDPTVTGIQDDGNALFTDCSNITVENTRFTASGIYSINVMSSTNLVFQDCLFNSTDSEFTGYIGASSNITINGCTFRDSNFGLILEQVKKITIVESDFISMRGGLSISSADGGEIKNCTFRELSNLCMVGYMINSFNLSGNHFSLADTDPLFGGYYCIEFYSSTSCIFDNNTFSESRIGIYNYYNSRMVFHDNEFDCSYVGLVVYNGINNYLEGNTFTRSGIHILGGIETFRTQELKNNTVGGRPILFMKDVDLDDTLIVEDAGQIILVNVSHARITGRTMPNTFSPIDMAGCDNISVSDCIFNDNQGALYAYDCRDIEIGQIAGERLENGIYLEECSEVTLTGCSLETFRFPLQVLGSHDNDIRMNTFIGGSPLQFRNSNDNKINGNEIIGGARLIGSFRNEIRDNSISSGRLEIEDMVLLREDQMEPEGNLIDGIEVKYFLNREGEVLHADEKIGGVIVYNCTDCSLEGVGIENGMGVLVKFCTGLDIPRADLLNCDPGIRIEMSYGTRLTECRVKGNTRSNGIVVWDSDQTKILECEVYGAGKGMVVDFSSNTDIRDSRIEGSTQYGIWLYNITRKSTILGNSVNGSGIYGINLETTNDNLISGNRISNSSGFGINLENNARNNDIQNNRLLFNHGSYGIFDPNLAQAQDSGQNNVWYLESSIERLGNYWSDLQGPDIDGDGIIDEPYQIPGRAGSQDRYPMSFGYRKPSEDEGRKSGDDIYPTMILLIVILGLLGFFVWKNISQSSRG